MNTEKNHSDKKKRIFRLLSVFITLVILAASSWVVYGFLKVNSWEQIVAAVMNVSPGSFFLALGISIAAYLVFGFYEYYAARCIGKKIPYRLAFPLAFICYAVGNSVGFANLGAFAVRTKYYLKRGFTVLEISLLMVFTSATYWSGFLLAAGVCFILFPFGFPVPGFGHVNFRFTGYLCLGALAVYIGCCHVYQNELPFFKKHIRFPRPAILYRQLSAGSADMLLTGLALFVLLPAGVIPLGDFYAVFLAAYGLSMLVTLPGGIGLLEAMLLTQVGRLEYTPEILAGLLIYRVVYFIIPLMMIPAVSFLAAGANRPPYE